MPDDGAADVVKDDYEVPRIHWETNRLEGAGLSSRCRAKQWMTFCLHLNPCKEKCRYRPNVFHIFFHHGSCFSLKTKWENNQSSNKLSGISLEKESCLKNSDRFM